MYRSNTLSIAWPEKCIASRSERPESIRSPAAVFFVSYRVKPGATGLQIAFLKGCVEGPPDPPGSRIPELAAILVERKPITAAASGTSLTCCGPRRQDARSGPGRPGHRRHPRAWAR
jgi:hypothetical protein